LNHKNFKLINGDVTDANILEKTISAGVDTIVHLAAQIHVDRSIIEPHETYTTNVLGTLNILELARRYDVEKVVYASTSEVYGSAQCVPMNENHPLDPPHPYGASKLAADRMCHAYIQTYAMNICIARLFNTFGPRQKDTGYGGVISVFAKRVMSDRPPIIYGDGKQSRDYLYIDDAIKAYEKILEFEKPLKDPINFGTGKDVTIISIADKIIKLFGKSRKLKPVHVAARPGEVDQLVCDNTRANKVLDWSPKFSFDQGLKLFVDWYATYKFEEWERPK
jgi:UDP-glucose 4-epimerase